MQTLVVLAEVAVHMREMIFLLALAHQEPQGKDMQVVPETPQVNGAVVEVVEPVE
jgi:hypothetical protein